MQKIIFLLSVMLLPFVTLNAQNNSCNLPKPTKLIISRIMDKSATVSWTQVKNAKGYTVSLFDSKGVLVSKSISDAPKFNFKNLEPNKSYKVSVAARCKVGNTFIESNNFTSRTFKTDIVIITDVVMRTSVLDDGNLIDIGEHNFSWIVNGVNTKYVIEIEDNGLTKHYLLLEKDNTTSQIKIYPNLNLSINNGPTITTNFGLNRNLNGNTLSISDSSQNYLDIIFNYQDFGFNNYNCPSLRLFKVP